MDIRPLEAAGELEIAYTILKELRTELDYDAFREIHEEARRRDGYRLVGGYVGDRCVAVMGYRLLFDYVHGKHLYVDDLVVTHALRSKGLGAHLLTYAEQEARRLGCSMLRLCTGIGNDAGKRFYERNGWHLRAVAFKKSLH